MIIPAFSYSLMEILCAELQERIHKFKVIDCYAQSLDRFYLILQGPTQEEALFFSFVSPLIRFHLSIERSSFYHHSKHPLLSFLKDAILNQISLLQQDRILQLTFSTTNGERKLIAEFFSKHPNYYVIAPDGKILFTLYPSGNTHYQLPPTHSFISPPPIWHNHREVEQKYHELEQQWELSQEKQKLHSLLSRQIKNLRNKEEKILNLLEECEEWMKFQHEGDLLKSHFNSIPKGASVVQVIDWMTDQPYDLVLDPTQTLQEEMAFRYKRAKKLQAGKIPLSQQLVNIRKKLQLLEEKLEKFNSIQAIHELTQFKQSLPSSLQSDKSSPKIRLPPPIYKEYESLQGVKIWVGKNAKMNEKLTFQLANGRDWWLHVRGYPGSHVIIKMNKNQEPDPETLKDAFQLALHYSKARNLGEGEICFTQRKYVSRLGQKKTGLVQISKHQSAWVRADPIRLQALKTR